MIYIYAPIVLLVWWLVVGFRIHLVHTHVKRRIEEVYTSDTWYKYHIDIDGAYNKIWFCFHMWTYGQFFPEVVTSSDESAGVKQ
jgi:hypothetical protein